MKDIQELEIRYALKNECIHALHNAIEWQDQMSSELVERIKQEIQIQQKIRDHIISEATHEIKEIGVVRCFDCGSEEEMSFEIGRQKKILSNKTCPSCNGNDLKII